MNSPFGPSGYPYASYAHGSQPGRSHLPPYSAPTSAPFTASYSVPSAAYNPLALQMRLVRAKQINAICKQAVIRNHLINQGGTIQSTSSFPMPSSVGQHPVGFGHERPPVSQPQKEQRSHIEQTDQQSLRRESAMNIPSAFGNAEETRRASTLSNANYGGGPILSPAPQPRTVSHEDHDDEDPPYEQPVQPPIRNPHREDSKLLSSLSESLTTTVAASATVLKKLNAKKNRIPPAERAKRKLEEMIKINAKTPAVMPLWRHRLNGRHDPPPETVLRGRRLFRLIAKAVMYMFIKPTVAVIRRKLNARESHRKDLQKTLRLLAGAFDDWLGKIVQLPVTSIVQDSTLQFDPAESLGINSQPLKTRMLQLKVRLRAVVQNIAKADMPSVFLTDSLIALVEDGNYFAPEVLWDCEVQQLEFNSLGGTRNMVPLADSVAQPDGLAGSVGSGRASTTAASVRAAAPTDAVTLSVADGVSLGGAKSEVTETVYASRVRLLLQNFLLLRTLVAHLLLAPWHCALCAPPSSRAARRVVYNHRMLATVVYELLRKLDPSLPVLPESSTGKFAASSQTKTMERFILQSRPAGAPYVLGDSMVAEARRVQQANPPPAAMQTPTAPAAGAATAARSRKLSAVPEPADGSEISAANASAGTGAAAVASATESSLLFQLAKLLGVRDAPPGEEAAPTQGSVESALLEQRFDFPTQTQLLSLLLPASQLASVRVYLDEWFAELRGLLDAWLQRVTVHVLTRRLALRVEREAKDNA